MQPGRRTLLVATVVGALSVAAAGALMFWFRGDSSSAGIAHGRTLYQTHCASCHGADLEGQPGWKTPLANGRMPAPPHDASGHTWHHSDRDLFTITKHGVSALVPGYESDMPGFDGVLSDEEIRAVLAFIKSTWPEKEREYQALRSRPAP